MISSGMAVCEPEASSQVAALDTNALKDLFNLKSIAVIGASEDQSKFGGRLFKNLLTHGFRGQVYPINVARDELFGLKTYPDLTDLPETPDAFVIALPSHLVKTHVERAAALGVKLGIIISSGFSDAGDAGRAAEEELVQIARANGMRLIGPNCLGMISPQNGIVLCSSPVVDRPDLPKRPIGFASQSGALMTTLFDRVWSEGGGFTHGFSVGNQADLEVCDFIDYFVADEATTVICAYIEGLKDASRFLESARRARAAGKPLLVVKAGRSEAGREAAFSHTASIAGDAAVFAAVCRQEGIMLVDDINIMFSVANVLASQPRRPIRNVAILTPSGGGGALAADALAEAGIDMATFDEKAAAMLSKHYPPGQAQNPIDFGTRVGTDESLSSRETVQALHQDTNTDAILCVMAMSPLFWQLQIIDAQMAMADQATKPVIFAIDAGRTSDPVRARLTELGLPYTNSTADAVKALDYLKKLGALQPSAGAERPQDCTAANAPAKSGQYDEDQAKGILAKYGVAVNEGAVATTAEMAAGMAAKVGFPVVMKIVSQDIVHKSDVGGVVVRLSNADEVTAAYNTMLQTVKSHVPNARIEGVLVQRMVEGSLEMIVGARKDVEFGPVVVFGAGGVLVEMLPDRFIATAPLSKAQVLEGLQSLPIWKMLAGYRGRTLDYEALVDTIVRVSWLAWDLRDYEFELDVNPVLVGSDHATAVDARLLIV